MKEIYGSSENAFVKTLHKLEEKVIIFKDDNGKYKLTELGKNEFNRREALNLIEGAYTLNATEADKIISQLKLALQQSVTKNMLIMLIDQLEGLKGLARVAMAYSLSDKEAGRIIEGINSNYTVYDALAKLPGIYNKDVYSELDLLEKSAIDSLKLFDLNPDSIKNIDTWSIKLNLKYIEEHIEDKTKPGMYNSINLIVKTLKVNAKTIKKYLPSLLPEITDLAGRVLDLTDKLLGSSYN
ncbi:MAG: hypothetical protein JRN26_04705 [Nitrososphaerota archaeon]|nr:hypothetical protein [Nitrososphaerota archaeon]MDG6931269.1 hypothetical protein [Nitrososphaerota archaeon]MDG6932136.1 hypothetical protein [Nitrososphaerota archaeon]MDG6936165.1 hypothetical protein [Nitrososphaerota archaeon]MDG6944067.1 hypothetical protein [Nitrososphaerota archaeon]